MTEKGESRPPQTILELLSAKGKQKQTALRNAKLQGAPTEEAGREMREAIALFETTRGILFRLGFNDLPLPGEEQVVFISPVAPTLVDEVGALRRELGRETDEKETLARQLHSLLDAGVTQERLLALQEEVFGLTERNGSLETRLDESMRGRKAAEDQVKSLTRELGKNKKAGLQESNEAGKRERGLEQERNTALDKNAALERLNASLRRELVEEQTGRSEDAISAAKNVKALTKERDAAQGEVRTLRGTLGAERRGRAEDGVVAERIVGELTRQKDAAFERNAELRGANSGLQEELAEERMGRAEDTKATAKEIGTLRKERDAARDVSVTLEEENRQLRGTLGTARREGAAAGRKVTKLQEKNAELRRDLTLERRGRRRDQTRIEGLEAKQAPTMEKNAVLEGENRQLQRALTAVDGKTEELKRQRDAAQSKAGVLQESLTEERRGRAVDGKEATRETNKLTRERDAAQAKAGALQESLTEERRERTSAQGEVRDLKELLTEEQRGRAEDAENSVVARTQQRRLNAQLRVQNEQLLAELRKEKSRAVLSVGEDAGDQRAEGENLWNPTDILWMEFLLTTPPGKEIQESARYFRLAENLTMDSYGNKVGIDPMTVSRIVQGETPSLESLNSIIKESPLPTMSKSEQYLRLLLAGKKPESVGDFIYDPFGDDLSYIRTVNGESIPAAADKLQVTTGMLQGWLYKGKYPGHVNEDAFREWLGSPSDEFMDIILTKAKKGTLIVPPTMPKMLLSDRYLFAEHLQLVEPAPILPMDSDLLSVLKDKTETLRRTNNKNILGPLIREIRETHGLLQTDLGAAGMYSQFEGGGVFPNDLTIVAMMDKFDRGLFDPITRYVLTVAEEVRPPYKALGRE